ncbi:hypothetical protein [Lacimicrobium alkaliphilum]|uniref:Uncharacterized protein n=1 Tax=Lacimicrobium alkaliphilum TaxID=1526571 RepID=A0A0U2ZI14_9ALTE|nr:hypothetical protein [Lacimicrobium alkaliphilum]ALS97980.1 hypothetical protein AT746_06685 [Lacimicrobium alkaliphilum]
MESESWLVVAGLVAGIVAVVHSVLGEVLIFRRMRKNTLVPTQGQPVLRERHVRILWATWHIVSVFGLAIAGGLLFMAGYPDTDVQSIFLSATVISMGLSSALVLFATKGMHPGWIGLLIVALSASMAF